MVAKNSCIPMKLKASEFSVPSSFDRDREISAGCKVDRKFGHMMDVVYDNAKKSMPWETKSDMLRFAMWHGMQHIKDVMQNATISNEVAQVKAVMRIVLDSQMQAQTVIAIDLTQRHVRELELAGDYDEVFQVLKKAQHEIEELDGNSFIGKKMRRMFNDKFAGYMKRGRISLKPRHQEQGEETE